jgi:hypothetical protein
VIKFNHVRYSPLPLKYGESQGIKVQYHDVRVNFEFRKVQDLVCHSGASLTAAVQNTSSLSLKDASLLVNYVYLDSEERKRFAQASHEYLIEQLQFTGSETVTSDKPKVRLNFNHPCKELVWTLAYDKWTDGNRFLAWNPTDFAAMRDEATRRFAALCGTYSTTGFEVASTTNSNLKPAVSGALLTKFNAVAPQVIGAIGSGNVVVGSTVNDITYETPLSWADISTPTSTLFSSFSTTESPATGSTVVVRDWFNYANQLNHEGNPISEVLLQLNGHDRFESQDGNYFNYVQPWEAHSATPSDGVNVYSFALNPEDHQPSGTCNFSRIDNATLALTLPNGAANSSDKQATLNVLISIGRNRCIPNKYKLFIWKNIKALDEFGCYEVKQPHSI